MVWSGLFIFWSLGIASMLRGYVAVSVWTVGSSALSAVCLLFLGMRLKTWWTVIFGGHQELPGE